MSAKTIGEMVQEFDETIKGLTGAVSAAQRNGGKPVLLADGRPMQVKAPQIGDLLLTLLHGQQLAVHCVLALGNQIGQGFVLSDAEAARVADLILARLKAAEAGDVK